MLLDVNLAADLWFDKAESSSLPDNAGLLRSRAALLNRFIETYGLAFAEICNRPRRVRS